LLIKVIGGFRLCILGEQPVWLPTAVCSTVLDLKNEAIKRLPESMKKLNPNQLVVVQKDYVLLDSEKLAFPEGTLFQVWK
jgi:hypothetical protein